MALTFVTIRSDGACWGNPGPSAIGVSIEDESGQQIRSISRFIGNATNNQAEYQALIAGLQEALNLGAKKINIKVDAELLELQIKGVYKVKHPRMKPLFDIAVNLLGKFERYEISRASRDENEVAHHLAQAALKKAKV